MNIMPKPAHLLQASAACLGSTTALLSIPFTALLSVLVTALLSVLVTVKSYCIPSENSPAGRSNQLCKSPRSGCTAHAGRWLKLTSGGDTFGVWSLAVAPTPTAEYAVRLRSSSTWIASGRAGLSSAYAAVSHLRLARSSSLTYWSGVRIASYSRDDSLARLQIGA